jgi:DNA helicase-2/ATP-dependent DNA helicase PcrA
VDVALLERLREWRTATAARLAAEKSTRVPAYIVATDATLQAIAEQHPNDAGELAEIAGIGPAKVADYGEEILAIVRSDA